MRNISGIDFRVYCKLYVKIIFIWIDSWPRIIILNSILYSSF